MELAFICNAGLALTHEGETLLIDAPNMDHPPFFHLTDAAWDAIRDRYNICGFFFTHDHPDHLDLTRLLEHVEEHSTVTYHIPHAAVSGQLTIGPFEIEYHPIPHAPIPDAPVHTVALIKVDGKTIYVTADAALGPALHKDVLRGRKADVAIWNSMYLSHADTRSLMMEVSERNIIYHMPTRPDAYGMWKKCDKNFERYGQELAGVRVIENYPALVIV